MHKAFLAALAVASLSALTLAQTPRIKTQPRLSIASRDFTVTNFGAVGDGQVLTDCSMLSSLATVSCNTGKFTTDDVGKVIAVYGAGTLRNGYRQPLAATIIGYTSAFQVQLSAAAQADVTNSERTVWGTNNTAAIQAAVDAAADAGGGGVEFPDGHYLTEGIRMDCAAIGSYPGWWNCSRAYNNISLKGAAAQSTILENWNPDTPTNNGVIDMGRQSEVPRSEHPAGNPNAPPRRLGNIEISNLTLRQVKYPTRPIKIINTYATQDVSIHDNVLYGYSYEGVYMGGGFKSVRWRVFNNVAYEIGKGGPAYGNTTSAFNLNGSYVEAFNNKASNCGQCFEAGARHAFFTGNICEGGVHSFLLGSTGSGVWDITISGNLLKNNYYGLVAGNGNGTIHSIRFLNNVLIDTPDVAWSYGGNTNTVVEVESDSVIHGQSVFSGNTFIFTNPALANRNVFRIFQNPNFLNVGSDTITIADNVATFSYPHTAPFLTVGGLGGYKWEPNKTFALNAPVVGSMWGVYWYRVITAGVTGATEPIWPMAIGQTVNDGTAVLRCEGVRPQVIFNNNSATQPANFPQTGSLYSDWPGAIRIDYGVREMLKVENFKVNNTNWRLMVVTPDMHEEIVPRDAPYSDSRRYSYSFGDTEPRASFWAVGWYIQKRTVAADGVYGWMTIRAGYAAPTYSPTASYSTFGTFVKPTTDNGFVYQLIGGACANTPEPTWPTGAGQTVVSGGCAWKNAANAAKFTQLK